MATPAPSPAVQPSLSSPTSSSSSSLQPASQPQLPQPHTGNPPGARPGTPSPSATLPTPPPPPPPPPQSQQQRGPSVRPQTSTRHTTAARPWWRPPARNYRPHPENHAIDSYITSTTLAVSQSTVAQPTSSPESLLHYWFRALNYILRIPFRELIGNISRPYDPTAPEPLADVPLNATIVDTHTNQVFPNPYAGRLQSDSGFLHVAEAPAQATVADSETPPQTTTRSRKYIPQIKKAWHDRTSNMSWALSTAFFTSFICTVVAIVALVVNWNVECTYLKVLLVVFVFRKWTVSFLMMDRALYRLPLGLVEPDPDIDEERHNGVAMYMRLLFTWHGYAMLFFGSFYVFFYGSSHYMVSAPVITGVAVAFSCMGLVPFFALLSMMLSALVLLYVVYFLFFFLAWPLEKCGLSRRRAISRRNGGYRSDGVTNTTDLRQVERTIEDEENGEGGGAGFGRTDNIKVTPAMASIPIVIFRKPKIQDSTVSPECATSSNIADSTANMDQDYFKSERLNFQSSVETVEVLEDTIEIRDTTPTPGKSFNLADRDAHSDLSSRSSLEQQGKSSGEHKMEDSGDSHVINMELTNSGSHRNAINKTSSTPGVRSGASSSSLARTTDAPWMATIVPQDSPSTSFMPCATGQEILDTEGCIQPASSISVPATGSQQPPQPMRRDSLSNSSTNSTSASNNGKSNTSAAFRSRVCPKIPVDDYPTIVDEECAICLFNFEDGDELRHLYCNHFFHRGCVDRWLTKNPFCPKCKRGI